MQLRQVYYEGEGLIFCCPQDSEKGRWQQENLSEKGLLEKFETIGANH